MMCAWWERFSSESENLSSWISEKEKVLEVINTTTSLDPLDKNISTVEVLYLIYHLFHLLHCPILFFSDFRSVLQVSTRLLTAHCSYSLHTPSVFFDVHK